MRFGIDFGTTRTVVALADRGNYPIAGFETADGEDLDYYPTVVAERDGELIFGPQALAAEEGTIVRSFKRLLGAAQVAPDLIVRIGRVETTLLGLLTGFFSALRHDLLHHCTLDVEDEPHQAIVATPANAHSAQRFITLEAARAAGFDVIAMMNEPSAAGVEYAHRHQRTLTSRRELVLVYDLGGGTFDASLVSMQGQSHDVLDSAGIKRLGGDDFDRVLFELALALVDVDPGALDEGDERRLLEHCRQQKERLHPSSKKIVVDVGACLSAATQKRLDVGEELSSVLKASRYYEACEPLVVQTLEVLARVLPGNLDEDALDRIAGVYVVGGASALPCVARALREWFGRRVRRSPYPSASTAIGLAIAFDEGSEVHVQERLARNFGVFREASDGAEVVFDALIDRSATVPSEVAPAKDLVRTYRPTHNVGHFRYVECGWLDDSGAPAGDITPYGDVYFPFDTTLRGRRGLEEVAIERTPGEGPRIEERYRIDASGVVSVTIRDLDSGYEKRHRIGPVR
ncbi:MAG: Hsp70 family protein [Deltaproteobacteria bacterium]